MPTALEVYDGLKVVCKRLKTVNGYVTDLPDANFNSVIIAPDEGATLEVSEYPRGYLVSLGADYAEMPGKRIQVTQTYIFTLLLGFTPASLELDPELKLRAALNAQADVERLVALHPQFASTDSLSLSAFSSDLSLSGPEVYMVFDLNVVYRRSLG